MFYKQCQRDLLVYEKTKQKCRLSMLRLRVSWRVHTVVVVAQGPGLRHLVDGEQPVEILSSSVTLQVIFGPVICDHYIYIFPCCHQKYIMIHCDSEKPLPFLTG